MRRAAVAAVVAAAASVLSLVGPGVALASTLTVTNCSSSGPGSLPAAVASAAAGDTITFAPSLSCDLITLDSTLAISKNVTITGPGAAAMAVSGGGAVPVLTIGPAAVVGISGLTIDNGSSPTGGGGIANDGGTVTLTGSTVTGSTVTGNTAFGGGIFNAGGGTVTLTGSTVSGNTAAGGGGIFNAGGGTVTLTRSTVSGNTANGFGGGLVNNGTMTLTGSTVSGNTAAAGGGGIFNDGTVTLTGSTVSGNTANGFGGGGILSIATVNVGGTIVAGNTSGSDPNCAGSGMTSAGYNLTNDTTGTLCGFTQPTDLVGADPRLGPLASNGGPTQTMLPSAGSPAVRAIPQGTTLNGVTVCPRTDQRGVASPPGGDCTIGAVEVPPAVPGVQVSASPPSGATVATPVTLTATVVGVAGVGAPTGSVSFTVDGSPASCGLVMVSGSQAQCPLGDLAAGTHSFGASYGGDANYQAAAGSLTGYGVSLLPTAETIAPTVAGPVFGQPAGFTATVTAGGSPVTSGSVQWLVDGTVSGPPVAVGPGGTATLGPVSGLSVGVHTIEADYSGSGQDAATTQQLAVVVGMAQTTTKVSVTGSALQATVAAVAPGAGTPAGMVTFAVNGTTAGTVALSASGTAVLSYKSAGAETVSASYSGDASFAPSSDSTATKNPAITATVSAKYPKTKYGWYRSPVTVTFTCTPGSAPLTAPCPAPVTLSRNGAAQMVSRTIHGTDGGIATAVVSPVSIDQVPPQITVTGVKNGASYDAPGPAKIACTATDTLSGLAGRCKLVIHRTGPALTWTATATDKAANTATSKGTAHLIDYFVAGATRSAGRFVVTVGKTYTVEAFILSATSAPRYVYAAPAGVRPHPVGPAMTKIGSHLWAIRVHITTAMDRRYKHWTLGVLTRRTLHTIPITLKR